MILRSFSVRFAWAYFVLYYVPAWVPLPFGIEWLATTPMVGQLWDPMVHWVARNVFAITRDIGVFADGSDSATYPHVRMLIAIVLAMIVAAFWAAIDARHRDDDKAAERLRERLHFVARVVLAGVLFEYGFFKVFPSQFPPSPLQQLADPYGSTPAHDLLWGFMAHSRIYQVFGGVLEVFAGLLLVSRRTSAIGGLLAFGVLTQVIVLNYGYAVFVRLGAIHLALLALYVVAVDGRRVLAFTIGQRAEAVPVSPLFDSARIRQGVGLVASAYVVSCFGWPAWDSYTYARRLENRTTPLMGIYEVTSFVADGREYSPVLGDHVRWRQLIVERWGGARVRLMDGTDTYFIVQVDTSRHEVVLRHDPRTDSQLGWWGVFDDPPEGVTDVDALHFMYDTGVPQAALRLRSIDDRLAMTLQRLDERQFRLLRPFRWRGRDPGEPIQR